MIKEAWDDFQRYKRDKELNHTMYKVLRPEGVVEVPCEKLRVGDIL